MSFQRWRCCDSKPETPSWRQFSHVSQCLLIFPRTSLHPQRFQIHFWSRVVWQEEFQLKDDELEELQHLYEAETWKNQNLRKEKQRQIAQKEEEEKNLRAARQRLDTLVNIICCACLRPERAAYFGMEVSLTHCFFCRRVRPR